MMKKCIHGVTKLGERGQIVIPLSIRKALKMQKGEELVVVARDNKIIVMPSRKLEEFYASILGQIDTLRTTLKK